MSNNGHSPTAQTFDEITVDLNRATKTDILNFYREKSSGDADRAMAADSILIEKVVTHWPFGDEISQASYTALGLIDARRTDDAVSQALELIGKKKSEPSSTPPENSNGA